MSTPREPKWGARNHAGFFVPGPLPAINPLLRLMGVVAYKGPSALPDKLIRARMRQRKTARIHALHVALGR